VIFTSQLLSHNKQLQVIGVANESTHVVSILNFSWTSYSKIISILLEVYLLLQSTKINLPIY